MIDNCASGGRRLDIETIGRATPFWRSDGPRDPIAHQCHTYGLLAKDHTVKLVTRPDADPRSKGHQVSIERAIIYRAPEPK